MTLLIATESNNVKGYAASDVEGMEPFSIWANPRAIGGEGAGEDGAPEHPDNADSPLVLVADGDDDLRDLLVTTLRLDGYFVIGCRDGDELSLWLNSPAIERLVLVVSDVQMPGPRPLETLERFYQVNGLPPVVLITGDADETVRNAADHLGAVLLEKPFHMGDLLGTIQMLVPR